MGEAEGEGAGGAGEMAVTVDDYTEALRRISAATHNLPKDHWAVDELDDVWERLNNELGELLEADQLERDKERGA